MDLDCSSREASLISGSVREAVSVMGDYGYLKSAFGHGA
jgi:hypothetical protein